MIRTINFIGRRGTFDLPSFLITENEPLTIKLEGLDATLGKYVLTIRQGEKEKTMYLSNIMSLDIPAEWLKSSDVNYPIEVFLELRDNAGTRVLISSAKTPTDQTGFYIEPLKLERVDKAWSMVAWLQRVEREIEAIKLNQKLTDAATLAYFKKIEDKFTEYEDKGVPLPVEYPVE